MLKEVPREALESMEAWEKYDLDDLHPYRYFFELLAEIHRISSQRAEEIKTRKWHEQREQTDSQRLTQTEPQQRGTTALHQKYPSLGPSQGSAESRIPSASSLFSDTDNSAGGGFVRANTEKSCDSLISQVMRYTQNAVFGNVMKLDFVERNIKLQWTESVLYGV
jgi:hypothetical protein